MVSGRAFLKLGDPCILPFVCLGILYIDSYAVFFFSSGSMGEAWQAYIAWEIEMGNINEARSLYKRCYSKRFPGTGSEVDFHADYSSSWLEGALVG